jgi:hypothetical protein
VNVRLGRQDSYPQPKTTLDGDYQQVKYLVNHLWHSDMELPIHIAIACVISDRWLSATFCHALDRQTRRYLDAILHLF